MEWHIKRTDPHAHHLSLPISYASPTRKLLLISDLHWDSMQCDRELLKRDLDKAVQDDALIFIFGDLFDAMQGKWDKRASVESFRPEHRTGQYLDSLVDTAAEWFLPYKDNLALISPGNHETSIQKHHETNLTERLVAILRHEKSRVELGTYWGYVMCVMNMDVDRKKTAASVIHYHHGYGGGGEVTRGGIDHSRTRGQYDADVFVSGHIHRRNMDENIITRLTKQGNVRQQRQIFLRCSAYKNEIGGWHAEKGRAARPLGGWWLSLTGERYGEKDIFGITLNASVT